MTETHPLAHVKTHLSELVDLVVEQQERVVLTRRGRPAAVLMSIDELESIEETLDLLSDPDALRQIREAERAIDAGDFVTAEQLRRDFLGE